MEIVCICYHDGLRNSLLLTANPVMYPPLAYALHRIHLGQSLDVGDCVLCDESRGCIIKKHVPRKDLNSAIIVGERIRYMKVPTAYVFALALNLVRIAHAQTEYKPQIEVTQTVLEQAKEVMAYLHVTATFMSLGAVPSLTLKYWDVLLSFINEDTSCS